MGNVPWTVSDERWERLEPLRPQRERRFRYPGRKPLPDRQVLSGILYVPAIARRGTRHGTGLGTYRWVVERSFAWLHGFRRLRIRWERRADIHEAFLRLACCLITYRRVTSLR